MESTGAVELFHVRSRIWYELINLPQALIWPSAAICGNQIYVIGHDGDGYSSSLQAISSNEPIRSQSISIIVSWTPLPRLSFRWSTALNGQLIVVGGE